MTNTATTTTYYERDAQGNILSTYTKRSAAGTPPFYQDAVNTFEQESVTLYGSSRLGEYRPNEKDSLAAAQKSIAAVDASGLLYRVRGYVHYEFTNHLGNVLAVVTDRKLSFQNSETFYRADILTLTDYYAFGQEMPDRTYNAEAYRYSINGQIKDTDIDPTGNHTSALYWEYDSRTGRRWNIDPVVKEWESPYMTFGDNPITGSDVLGCPPQRYHICKPLINNRCNKVFFNIYFVKYV